MNILLFAAHELKNTDLLQLSDRRQQHLLKVLRAEAGDTVRVGQINGLSGQAEILSLDSREALLKVRLDREAPAKLPLSLVVALPRPKMLRRILRTAAECGAGSLHLINSYRVEKSYWQSPLLRDDKLREYLLQGLEQAQDTVVPEIRLHHRFRPFVEDTLPSLLRDRDALLAQPGALEACPTGCQSPRTLVLGPEGGLIPWEVEKLLEAGCRAVSLGPRILRVDTALSAALGRLLL